MTLRARTIVIGLLALFMIVTAIPNFIDKKVRERSALLPDAGLNLGLDLQGGIHLLLRVSEPAARKQELTQIMSDLQSAAEEEQTTIGTLRLNDAGDAVLACGTAETVLAELVDARRSPVEISAGPDECLELRLTGSGFADVRQRAVDQSMEVLKSRLNELGTVEPVIAQQGEGRILVQMPGYEDRTQVANILSKTTFLEFKQVLRSAPNRELLLQQYTSGLPPDTEVVCARLPQERRAGAVSDESEAEGDDAETATAPPAEGEEVAASEASGAEDAAEADADAGPAEAEGADAGGVAADAPASEEASAAVTPPAAAAPEATDYCDTSRFDVTEALLVKEKADLVGAMLEDARWSYDRTQRPIINFTWGSEGTQIFREFTENNIGERMAIIKDNEVISAPVIRARIGREGIIEGSFTAIEAQTLAVQLRSGALPIPLVIEEERTLGASLGEDAIRAGTFSIALGSIAVVLFMIMYYRTAGALANAALVLNIFIIIAIMGSVQATLTLPGIAGLVLTVGMAVDANVIIFERIREELKSGKTMRSAVQIGFNRSRLTILDANITTLIAAVVLYYVGRGPVQGFGVTLAIGIVSSVFCALVVTRVLVDLVIARDEKLLRI